MRSLRRVEAVGASGHQTTANPRQPWRYSDQTAQAIQWVAKGKQYAGRSEFRPSLRRTDVGPSGKSGSAGRPEDWQGALLLFLTPDRSLRFDLVWKLFVRGSEFRSPVQDTISYRTLTRPIWLKDKLMVGSL